jgi:molybdopterin-containing oxidoreductase family iron-sulfur binding subunit
MEKCSMCVQRIEEARASSRRAGQPLAAGDIATACQQSCPAQAITFGDANDPASALARTRADARAYAILEEINVKPQVTYMTRIKNRGQERDSEGGPHHG